MCCVQVKKRICFYRNGELNLTANRITHIKPEPLLKLPYPMRFCTLIPDIATVSFDPKFCEFDTVGVVVSTGPAPHVCLFYRVEISCFKWLAQGG